jgi:perosamine synthetase
MKSFNTIGNAERGAADHIIEGYPLSGYIGSHPTGGRAITELELGWEKAFDIKHAVAVNSATSGLLAACMAIEVGPGDEVIVSPYTMSATAAAPKVLGATLVWADIERETYTLDPVDVANSITRKTKAVIVTNLFGHAAHLHELRSICDDHGVYLIEDNAQSIFAQEQGRYAGTIGHMGVFSLNVHKHLQVGEGGIVVTASNTLDTKLREAMNHGEMRGGITGLNLRMTEITAAMAIEQLKKAPEIIAGRMALAQKITDLIPPNDVLIPPSIRQGCTHSYYVWGAQLRTKPRKPIPEPFRAGYLRPLYELKAFKSRQIWLPAVEDVEDRMVLFEVCAFDPTDEEINTMVSKLRDAL